MMMSIVHNTEFVWEYFLVMYSLNCIQIYILLLYPLPIPIAYPYVE